MKKIPIRKLKTIPILEVASKFGIEVERRGKKYLALCPAHNDRSMGSMFIKPETNTWHCFSCHNGGSNIDLVMFHLKAEYTEAIKAIAERFGIEPEETTKEERQKAKVRLTKEDYRYLGIEPWGAVRLEGKYLPIDLRTDEETHDTIIRGKLIEKALSLFLAKERLLNEEELIRVSAMPLDELPILAEEGLKKNLLRLLEIGERAFFNPQKNPFPKAEAYHKLLQLREKETVEPIEITL